MATRLLANLLRTSTARMFTLRVSGRLGSKDGYVTFDPTGFKVGDFIVPVSLVNDALQKKLAEPENREQLKLPDFVKSVHIENGELVVEEKN